MQTRRKSSEQIQEPSVTKKVKTNENTAVEVEPPVKVVPVEAQIKSHVTDIKTRKLLKARGITSLFPIQYRTYGKIFGGKDIIGQDRTGSGKTLAYCLPLSERLREQGLYTPNQKQHLVRILVVVPTRELAIQVTKEVDTIKHEANEFKALSVYGGTPLREAIFEVKNGAEWIIGTPGRLLDLMRRGVLVLTNLKAVILDEADQMLQLGFQEDLEQIFKFAFTAVDKKETQILMFSATIPMWMKKLSQNYMKTDREVINLINLAESQSVSTVIHYALPCSFGSAVGIIGDVVSVYGGRHSRTIIFCETKAQANDIMLKAKLTIEMQVLHGDIAQKQREVTFNAFKTGKFKCLVATNVASRGLDFPEVDLIIQLQPPKEIDTYIHRAGRTARAGRSGVCITFYTKNQENLMDRIERQAKLKFQRLNAPQPSDIIKASKRDLVVSLTQVSSEIVELFKPVAEEISGEMDTMDALCRALAYISGYKDKINQRSMLGSFEGYITVIIRSSVPFRTISYVWAFLRQTFDVNLVSGIKGMKMLQDNTGVIFDLAEDQKQIYEDIFERYLAEDSKASFTYEIPTSLPDIQQDVSRGGQQQGGYGGQQGGYGGQQGGYGQQRGGGQREQQKYFASPAMKQKQEVFIGGLNFDATTEEVSALFQRSGVEFKDLRFLQDDAGNFKGIAFGLCQDEQMVATALTLDGTSFKNRKLRINMANQKPSR